MKKIAIFYGSKGGNTELVANKIHKAVGTDQADIFAIPDVSPSKVMEYDNLIFGVSTVGADSWDQGHAHSSWDSFFVELNNFDLHGKKAAVFGLGDQIIYPDHYCDDMKIVYDHLKEQGTEMVGEWHDEDYEYSDSKAVVDGHFIGLALDEDQQFDLTAARIEKWTGQLKNEYGF